MQRYYENFLDKKYCQLKITKKEKNRNISKLCTKKSYSNKLLLACINKMAYNFFFILFILFLLYMYMFVHFFLFQTVAQANKFSPEIPVWYKKHKTKYVLSVIKNFSIERNKLLFILYFRIFLKSFPKPFLILDFHKKFILKNSIKYKLFKIKTNFRKNY